MVVEQEYYKIVPKVPDVVATITVEGEDPADLFNKKTAVYINFGKQKNKPVIEYPFDIIFNDSKVKFKTRLLETECGCTKSSTVLTKPDGNIEILFRYNATRIGFQDKGDFRKSIKLQTDKGSINFVLLISEQK